MDERDIAMCRVLLPALIIVGGVVVMVAGIRQRPDRRSSQHQERIAMIERGMTPPESRGADRQRRAHGFKLSLGILLCGLGLGLLMLITFAGGAPETGIGIGGAIVMVGIGLHRQRYLHRAAGAIGGGADDDAASRDAGRAARALPPVGSPSGPPARRSDLERELPPGRAEALP